MYIYLKYHPWIKTASSSCALHSEYVREQPVEQETELIGYKNAMVKALLSSVKGPSLMSL